MMKKGTLAGRRIVVTRSREQASELSVKLRDRGAEVLELPLIRVEPEISKQDLADTMLELGGYDWLAFTSANGVRYFFEQFFRLFDDIRSLGLVRCASVGGATSAALAALHLRVECQPENASAEALADALIATDSLDNAKILVVTGNLNRDILVRKLEEARAIVDRLQVYRTELVDPASLPAASEFRERGADAVLLASSSAAEAYGKALSALELAPGAVRPLAGSIGPQTSESLRAAGITVDFEARRPGLDELVDALEKRLAKAGAKRES
jgi:uroporphyrinogen-III synthase